MKTGWSFITEAAKVTVFVVFVLYVIGFVIWHSYLGGYGVTAHGLLRTEFISAAICYLLILVAFAGPAMLAFHNATHPKEEGTYEAIFVVWALLLPKFVGFFFPGGDMSKQSELAGYLFGAACICPYIQRLKAVPLREGSESTKLSLVGYPLRFCICCNLPLF